MQHLERPPPYSTLSSQERPPAYSVCDLPPAFLISQQQPRGYLQGRTLTEVTTPLILPACCSKLDTIGVHAVESVECMHEVLLVTIIIIIILLASQPNGCKPSSLAAVDMSTTVSVRSVNCQSTRVMQDLPAKANSAMHTPTL